MKPYRLPSLPVLSLALAATALSGCAGTGGLFGGRPAGPDTTAPATTATAAVPPPAAWQAPLPHAGQTTDLLGWWSQFDDPQLLQLVEAAQRVSPTLAGAATRIEQARAARTGAAAARMPLAELAGAASRGRAEPGAPIATAGSLALQASWEIDLFGAVRAGVDAGQARLEGAEAAWHGARVSLAAEVATAYVGLRGCEALLAEQEVDARSRAETARVTERSAQAGVTAPAAAAQARASAAQARSQVVAQRAQCDSQVKALVALTADAEPGLRQRLASRTGQIPAAAPIAFDTLPARLLAQRPDLAEAAAQVTAAAADQRLADARRWPRVSLGGSFGYMDVRTPGVHQDGSTWSFGPLQVSFPVFDGGVRRANQQAARSAYDEAVVQYQAKLRTAVREVEDALLQLRSTADRQADARAAADGFETSFKAAETRYQGGVASLFELEDARRTLVAARSVVVELQRERTSAWISLYRALGGGWQSAGATTAAQAS